MIRTVGNAVIVEVAGNEIKLELSVFPKGDTGAIVLSNYDGTGFKSIFEFHDTDAIEEIIAQLEDLKSSMLMHQSLR